MRIVSIILAFLATGAASTAFALPVPYQTPDQPQHRYADKQYGYARVDTDASGRPVFKVEFSNAKRIVGPAGFRASAILMIGDRPIATVSVKRDLQVRLFKKIAKVHVHQPIDITAEDWSRVTEIRYVFADAIPQSTIDSIKSGKDRFPVSNPSAFP